MYTDLDVHTLVLFSLATGWSAILLPPLLWGHDKHKSISAHATASKKAYILTTILELLSAVSLGIFLVKWLVPTFNMPVVLLLCCVYLFISLTVVALIPPGKRRVNKIHDVAATSAFVLFLPIIASLVLINTVPTSARIINAICLCGMLSIIIRSRFRTSHHLYFEAIYILLFDVGLLSVAFLK